MANEAATQNNGSKLFNRAHPVLSMHIPRLGTWGFTRTRDVIFSIVRSWYRWDLCARSLSASSSRLLLVPGKHCPTIISHRSRSAGRNQAFRTFSAGQGRLKRSELVAEGQKRLKKEISQTRKNLRTETALSKLLRQACGSSRTRHRK